MVWVISQLQCQVHLMQKQLSAGVFDHLKVLTPEIENWNTQAPSTSVVEAWTACYRGLGVSPRSFGAGDEIRSDLRDVLQLGTASVLIETSLKIFHLSIGFGFVQA